MQLFTLGPKQSDERVIDNGCRKNVRGPSCWSPNQSVQARICQHYRGYREGQQGKRAHGSANQRRSSLTGRSGSTV